VLSLCLSGEDVRFVVQFKVDLKWLVYVSGKPGPRNEPLTLTTLRESTQQHNTPTKCYKFSTRFGEEAVTNFER
jgi:hypothetical protein